MKAFRIASVVLSFSISVAIPAMAGVTVNSPARNDQVSSPFKLYAWATSCGSQDISAMGYSFDSSSDTTIVKGQSIDKSIGGPSGNHTLHVKAWGKGTVCVADVAIDIRSGGSGGSEESIVPSGAASVTHLDAMSGWRAQHDRGGPGSSSGSTKVVSSPSLSGSAREFETGFSNSGDERYSLNFSDDTSARNFFYDAWFYVTSSSNHIGNLEFDINQTMSGGNTVMFGIVCDGYTGHWAYTANTGSGSHPAPRHATLRRTAHPAIPGPGHKISGITSRPITLTTAPAISPTIQCGSTEPKPRLTKRFQESMTSDGDLRLTPNSRWTASARTTPRSISLI